MNRSSSTIPLLLGSLLLVILAIAVTGFISLSQKKDGQTTDIRARASAVSTLSLKGTVKQVDVKKGMLIVRNLRFTTVDTEDLGEWTITPPPEFDLSKLTPNAKLLIKADSKTFSIPSRTLTAVEITVTR